MELIKPEPLVIGGRAHYTLNSYDPVQVEVHVPRIMEDDITIAYVTLIMQAGGEPSDTTNDVWIHKTFGLPGVEPLRAAVKAQVQASNDALVEEQKVNACAEALAERLMQRVPSQRVAQIRTSLVRSFTSDLAADKMTEADFLAMTGMSPNDLERMFDEQAQTSARHEAAVLAWAENRKVEATDDEIPELVGIPEDQDAQQIIADAKASGFISELRQGATQNKAMRMIVDECECTYIHETVEEAEARVAQMLSEMRAAGEDKANAKEAQDEDDQPRLKLV